MRSTKFLVYCFVDVCIDEIVKQHCDEYHTKGLTVKPKYQFLIHLLIERSLYNKKNQPYIYNKKAEIVLGRDYYHMLRILYKMSIIKFLSKPSKELQARIELVNHNITKVSCQNLKVIGYIKKYHTLMQRHYKEIQKERKKQWIADVGFDLNKYEECLKMLKLPYYDKACEKIESMNDDYKKMCWKERIDKFKNNKERMNIWKIDNNRRIYHYLTNLPRDLKQYHNIKYQLDISNSHPLLLIEVLFNHYQLSYNDIVLLYYLCNILYNKNDYCSHSLPHSLYSLHICCKKNGIVLNNNKLQNIPIDIVGYIRDCSNGNFWYNLLNDSELSRRIRLSKQELKAKIFGNVFYCNKEYPSPYIETFKRLYPTVLKIIQCEKQRLREQGKNLACELMKIESSIFHEILNQCYQRELKVVNIHDALIVLDVEVNRGIGIDDYMSIIKEVYAKHLLFPTIKVDEYVEGVKIKPNTAPTNPYIDVYGMIDHSLIESALQPILVAV